MAILNQDKPVGRVLRFKARDLLTATNRGTDGRGYEQLKAAFERLGGTRITTNIATGEHEVTTGFGLIESWEIVRKSRGGRMVSVNKGDWDRSAGPIEDMAFHREWIAACHRKLKPGGTIWISGTYHSIYQCGWALQEGGWHILNDIAWFKPNASPNLSCRMFTASHETLIWARTAKKHKHIFNYDAMKYGDYFINSERIRSIFYKDPYI